LDVDDVNICAATKRFEQWLLKGLKLAALARRKGLSGFEKRKDLTLAQYRSPRKM
jgi:hypothetical protein